MQPTDPEQRSRVPAAVEHQACPPSSQSETSGPSASVKWSAGRGPGRSGSGIATRSKSSGNPERRKREAPGGHAPERDDARRGGRARRRRLRRRVRDGDVA